MTTIFAHQYTGDEVAGYNEKNIYTNKTCAKSWNSKVRGNDKQNSNGA